MNLLNDVKPVSKYVSEDKNFWNEHLLKFLQSSLSRAEYCRKEGINPDRFRYWKKVLEQKKLELLAEDTAQSKLTKLLPVGIKEERMKIVEAAGSFCSIKLSNGTILEIHARSVVEEILSRVLKCG
jgi:hypothetical protein